MAEQLVGREAVNELFRFDALGVSTELELDMFVGDELESTKITFQEH